MLTSTYLLRQRRFLPLFATQLLNAFNDNLYKNAMVLFVVYSVYNSEKAEAQFSRDRLGPVHPAVLRALGAVGPARRHARQGAGSSAGSSWPRSASCWSAAPGWCCLAGHLTRRRGDPADAAGAVRDGRAFDLLRPDQIRDPAAAPRTRTKCSPAPGWSRRGPISRSWPARSSPAGSRSSRPPPAVIVTALLGYVDQPQRAARRRRSISGQPLDWHVIRSSIALVSATPCTTRGVLRDPGDQLLLDHRRGAVHPVPAAGQERADWPTRKSPACSWSMFSIGVAIGSVAVNALLKGEVSARYAPASVLAMGAVRRLLLPRLPRVERAPHRRADGRPRIPRPAAGAVPCWSRCW